MSMFISVCLAGSIFFLCHGARQSSIIAQTFTTYEKRVACLPLSLQLSHWGIRMLTMLNLILSAAVLAMSLLMQLSILSLLAGLIFVWPWAANRHFKKMHTAQLAQQMDNMLANLANAVRVTGNLYNAIEDVAEGEPEPMRAALKSTLHEIRLGKTEEDALQRFAARSGIPLLRTAIGAVIVGKRMGGSLGTILSSTAQGIREIKRLEGVLKVKTAEGRNQAWVMGLLPLFLCSALQLLNPLWLAPMWSTPLGWLLVAGCIVLEGLAIMLIRKILAVTI